MEQRNVILAFALSMLILLGWGMMFPPAEQAEQTEQTKQIETSVPSVNESISAEGFAEAPELRPDVEEVQPVRAATPAPDVTLKTKTITGSTISVGNELLSLDLNKRGWIVGARLNKYRESLEEGSPPVAVLGEDEPHAQYMNSGLLGEKGVSDFEVVSKESVDGAEKIHLRAKLADGRIWDRTYTFTKGSYQIDVEDRVEGGIEAKLFRQVVERYPDRETSNFYEHAGPIALLDDILQEVSYDDLDDEGTIRMASNGGWTGIMNRYFITAMYADQKRDYRYYFKGDGRSYQAGMLDDGVMDGKTAVFKSNIYIGPKHIATLEKEGVKLERSVDFGWFAFISKPLYDGLTWFYNYVPNYGWCIILLLIVIKTVFFYPTQKSYQSMAAMRKLQPEQKKLQERYGDDRQQLGQEMMALYKKNKVNPLGGCLPILIQIPVFFALYKVLLMSIEMRQAPFIGWLTDLSVQDPYFILPLLMGASMFVQQRLNPQPPDPMQAKIMSFLPALFTVMFLFFPAGLVLYWVVNNVLSIVQQRLVMARMGVD
ncbi:MAG: membrane protein insertase YidC [Mariprofundaceae bacterium]